MQTLAITLNCKKCILTDIYIIKKNTYFALETFNQRAVSIDGDVGLTKYIGIKFLNACYGFALYENCFTLFEHSLMWKFILNLHINFVTLTLNPDRYI